MLTPDMRSIIEAAKPAGWVLEPQAKRLLKMAGVDVPRFAVASTVEEALAAAGRIGYPVVAKVVSAAIVHKSEVDGVAVGVPDADGLRRTFDRLAALRGFAGVLVEEMLPGIELILGAVDDFQFGPVVLMGIGGTGVEIYKDTVIRMAPLGEADVSAMAAALKGAELLKGHRGAEPVNLDALTRLVISLSNLVMDLEGDLASMDLNPVKCGAGRCVAADARIILKTFKADTS